MNKKSNIQRSMKFAVLIAAAALILSLLITAGSGEDVCPNPKLIKGFIYDMNGKVMNGSSQVRITAYSAGNNLGSELNGNTSGFYSLGIANLPSGTTIVTLNVTNKTSNELIYSSLIILSCEGANIIEPFNFPRPNLTVTNIAFTPESPTEGIDTVIINATITAGNVNGTTDVLFYDGDNLINYTTVYFPKNSSVAAVMNRIFKYAGMHTITVVPGSWNRAGSKTIDVKSIYNESQKLTYDSPQGGDKVVYVKIPKSSNVTFAEINITGSAYFVASPVNIIDKWKSWYSASGAYKCYEDDTYCFGFTDSNGKLYTKIIFNSSETINVTKLNTHTIHSDYSDGSQPRNYNLTLCETNNITAENASCSNVTPQKTLVNNSQHNPLPGPNPQHPGYNYDSQAMNNPQVIEPGRKYLMKWEPLENTTQVIARLIDNITGAMIYPGNVNLNLSNSLLWNHTGILNTTETIGGAYNLTQKLNSQLISCNCPGCIALETECAIPLIIHSDARGVIDVSINVQSIPRGARIIVEPQYTNALVNGTFIINVTISGTDIYAADFELTFNPGIIGVLSMGEGDFLSSRGNTATAIQLLTAGGNESLLMEVNNTQGRITFGNSIIGNTTGVTGSGLLAWIQFKAKEKGISSLHLKNYNISNSNTSAIENVTAVDGLAEVTGETSAEFIIILHTGWNLISIPVIPANNSIPSVLEPISGKYDNVIRFNGVSQQSEYYTPPPFPPEANDFNIIESGRGYWIYATENANLTVYGARSNEMNVGLSSGWNLDGWMFLNNDSILNALLSISGKYDNVIRFNGVTQQSEYYTPPPFPPEANDFNIIESGRGYWIYATENSNWTYSV